MLNRYAVITAIYFCSLFLSISCSTNKESYHRNIPDLAIRPYEENPRYWQYKGDPVMLVGGSVQDNLFQVRDPEAQLDLLASVGGNYVRNTMSSRDEGDIWEFEQLENGKYDLGQLNTAYFNRFAHLLEEAYQRDIIVQIELWDRFDFAREPWLENPFRPANNDNYTPAEIGLENEYPEHPGSNNNPFFRSIPEQDHNKKLLVFQRKRVDKILDISLRYPNVLYVMDNETSANADWGAYWARYIKQKADSVGVAVYVTEMWDAWNLKDEEHRQTLDHPERYDFADISQNNHNSNDQHWENLQWARTYVSEDPRPLNNVKIYGSRQSPYGSQRDALERFWRNIIGGAASARFHRPASGIGLGDTAQVNLSSAAMLFDRYLFFDSLPDTEHSLLRDREEDEAYLTRRLNGQYALYFPDGGSVQLDLRNRNGNYLVQWLDIDQARWKTETRISGGQWRTLQSPGDGQWVALVGRENE
ncbi:MAG: hypothetical protein R3281_10920 [Balneolaceae bacterium]|nr:hypothetical protein [Balneolaceae bacterium]